MSIEQDAASSSQRSVAWRTASVCMGLAFLALLGGYWDTFTSITAIWERSATFAHGFAVPVIAAWLVWHSRDRLTPIVPRPAWGVLPLLAGTGLGWLLGNLGQVNSLSQFSFVLMLALLVPCVAGLAATRVLLFPLGFFLAFTVPIGEFLLPQLMESTADFTVFALRLTGVPVFREGQQLVIPSGNWSVVEACSGIRYLIASLMVGSLYAYLNYKTLWRRIAFVLISGLVPLVANWLRAYMIVMIGHLSSNRLATGVDHIIYGWVFFGVVMALMFWAGSFWHEYPSPQGTASQEPVAQTATPSSARLIWLAALAAILVACAPKVAELAIQKNQATAGTAHIKAPLEIPGWQASSGGLTTWQPRFTGASDVLHQTYRRGDREVGLYVAYYRNQDREHKLVSSENTLAGVDGKDWVRVAVGAQEVSPQGNALKVITTDLRGQGTEPRLTAWHWYWVGGRLTPNEYLAKAYTAFSRLLGQGDDSAAVVVYVRRASPGEDVQVLSSFVADSMPSLEATLQGTRGGN